jgi:5'-nucleotidase
MRPLFITVLCWALSFPSFGGDKRLTILLSNDDGYDAPGLEVLYRTFSSVARVIVAAPRQDQSGVGHGITYREPILVERIKKRDEAEWYAVSGKPATCVRLALEGLLSEKPDLVITGINRGENLGVVSFYSGTVAAAREAAINGIPALAVSQKAAGDAHYEDSAIFTRRLVERLRTAKQLIPGLLLNVNIPAHYAKQIKGVLVTRQSVTPTAQSFERHVSPEGQTYFWSIYRPLEQDNDGTDVSAFNRGYISITPLQTDQTYLNGLDSLPRLAAELWRNLAEIER